MYVWGASPVLSSYIKAGYTPICGCRLDSALEYVQQQMGMYARLNAECIEVELVPGSNMWAPSGYYWENELLLKREA